MSGLLALSEHFGSAVLVEAALGGGVRTGSGFVIRHGGASFLVTARHIVGDDSEVDLRLTTNQEASSHELRLKRVDLLEDGEDDIAVFALPFQITSNAFDVPLDDKGSSISGDVIVIGFPHYLQFGVSVESGSSTRFPMVKHGIIAAMNNAGGRPRLYLDLLANPGFSGAPIFSRPGLEPTAPLRIVGMVIQTASQESQEGSGFGSHVYADISVGVWATSIREHFPSA